MRLEFDWRKECACCHGRIFKQQRVFYRDARFIMMAKMRNERHTIGENKIAKQRIRMLAHRYFEDCGDPPYSTREAFLRAWQRPFIGVMFNED